MVIFVYSISFLIILLMPTRLVLMFPPLLFMLVFCVFSLCLARSLYILLIFFKEPDFYFIHILSCFCFQFHLFIQFHWFLSDFYDFLLFACFGFALLFFSNWLRRKLKLLTWECLPMYFFEHFLLATLIFSVLSTSVLAIL